MKLARHLVYAGITLMHSQLTGFAAHASTACRAVEIPVELIS